jgi:hypothetical protein
MYTEFDEAQAEAKVLVPEVKTMKQQWLEALRSNKYEQGYGFMHRKDKFCALGVLDEVKIPLSTRNRWDFISEKDANNIIMLNDKYKWSFKRIADWIELNVNMEATPYVHRV